MSLRRPVALLLVSLALWPCAAQQADSATPPTVAVKDTEAEWRIGIASFDASKVDPEHAYLTHSVPLLLRERLRGVPAHHLDEEGRLAVGRAVLAAEARELVASLRKLREERDALLFGSASGRAEKAARYDQRIADALRELTRLKQTPPQEVLVSESKPVRLVEGGEGQLLEQAVRSPVEAARSNQLDLLVWGGVEQLQEYLYVEARAFDAARGRVVLHFREAAGVDSVQEVVTRLGDELARLVWGREWASLSVQAQPAGALVWVNEQFVGRAPVRLEFLVPGTTRLRVQSPGYAPSASEFELEAYAAVERTVALEAADRPLLALGSVPEGAAVYVGADWLGTTPLQLPRPEGSNRLLLRKEGYRDTSLYLEESGAGTLSVDLLPEEQDPRAEQLSRRDKFYLAFGMFALSLPVPYFCWGFAGDYAVSYADTGDPALWNTAQSFYWAYVGGLVISGGLLANMVVRLVRYVRAADRRA